MYKKIFSAILFGALTIASTSTFVSCKDYDDDIKNIQAQIDELNQQKLVTINNSIDALKKADTDLQKAITDGDAATLAAAKTLIAEAISDCQEACKTNLATSQAAQDAKFDEAITKVNQRVDDIVKLLSDQDGNIQQVGKDLKALSDKLATFEAQYGNLTTAFTDLTQRVTNLEDAVKAQKAALEEQKKALDDLAKTIGTGTGSNGYDDATLKQDIKAAGDRISDLETKVNDLQAQLTEKFNQLTEKLNTVSGDLNDLKQAHTDFATQVTNQLTELTNNYNSVKAQADALGTALGKLDVMLTILASDLRSLVYMPKLYVDGIETIEYPYLRYALETRVSVPAFPRLENDLIRAQNIGGELYDLAPRTDSTYYAPVWPLEYHINPGNAQVEFSDIQGYYAYNAEVLTRAFFDTKKNDAATWGIVAKDRWDNQYVNLANWSDYVSTNVYNNNVFYNTKGGIMTVGLQLSNGKYSSTGTDNPNWDDPSANYFPSDLSEDANDDKSPESVHNIILALQAKSSLVNKQDTTITSDYAQLLPEKVKLEGLIWNKHPEYWDSDNDRIKDFWQNKKGYGPAYAQAPTVHPQTGLPNTYGAKNPAGWDYGYRKGDQNKTMGRDTICPVTRNWIHVWATPQEALKHPADIELYTSNRSGINLVEYMGVHWYYEQNAPLTENVARHGNGKVDGNVNNIQTWAYNAEELQRYGFVWVFDTLDYTNDANATRDSRYIWFKDHKKGTIIAQNVRESGATYEDETHTAVGREPLVRVRLYHFNNIKDMQKWQDIDKTDDGIKKFNDDNIPALNAKSRFAPVLDGYIRIHITKPELLEIASYPTWPVTFDLCNGVVGGWSTWAQFSKWVLTDALDNMEKEQFDALYQVEEEAGVSPSDKVKELVQYTKPRSTNSENMYYGYEKKVAGPANWLPNKSTKDQYKVGHIYTREDEVGTTNHTYRWEISEAECEALTHHATGDQGENGVEITRYIHYTGHFYSSTDPNNAGSKYDDIFIKLTMKISRKDVPLTQTSKRDENYWYMQDGSWNGYFSMNPETNDALRSIAINTPYPKDVETAVTPSSLVRPTIPWTYELLAAWDRNNIVLTPTEKRSKLYIAPFEYEIKALNGTVYIVTPRRGSGDNIYNKFICKYVANNNHAYILDQSNPFNSTELEKNNTILNSCAINYQPDAASILSAYGMNIAVPTFTTKADEYEWMSKWPKADGVFSNDTLYAYVKGTNPLEYEPIAIITNPTTKTTPTDGTAYITLLHEFVENKWLAGDHQPSGNKYTQSNIWDKENTFAEECLNAEGYELNKIGKQIVDGDLEMLTGEFEDHGNPIGKQLRAYLGVIATNNECNVANQMNDTRTKNFAVFQTSWERPINILEEADFVVDAINNGDYIYMVDILKLFDWRGASNVPVKQGPITDTGYMWGDTGIPSHWTVTNWRPNQWLWAYYGVKAITIDLRTSAVQTNLSQTNPATFVPMSQVSNMVRLTGNGTPGGKNRNVVSFDLRNPIDYAKHTMNQDLIDYMGLNNPRQEGPDTDKAKFGYIFYENNELNVQDFKIKVPISVTYDWGVILDQPLVINVHFTRGNTTTNP